MAWDPSVNRKISIVSSPQIFAQRLRNFEAKHPVEQTLSVATSRARACGKDTLRSREGWERDRDPRPSGRSHSAPRRLRRRNQEQGTLPTNTRPHSPIPRKNYHGDSNKPTAFSSPGGSGFRSSASRDSPAYPVFLEGQKLTR